MKIEVFAKCTQAGEYNMIVSYTNFEDDRVASPEYPPDLITMPQNAGYGGLNKATINVNSAGLNLEELDVTKEMSLKVKRSEAMNYTGLGTSPDEIEDIFCNTLQTGGCRTKLINDRLFISRAEEEVGGTGLPPFCYTFPHATSEDKSKRTGGTG